MKSLILCVSAAALAMLAAGSGPAAARSDMSRASPDKCVWQAPPQYGPRAPLRAPVCLKPSEAYTGMGGPECDSSYTGKTGHYVWRSRPQAGGPRAPLQAPELIWLEAC